MDVRCEKCGTEYELDEARLKPGGVTVKCTNCGHMFKIRKRAPTNVGGTPPPEILPKLATLQQWIVSGTVTRESMISRTGKTWKRLGYIAELSSFFIVADEARQQ